MKTLVIRTPEVVKNPSQFRKMGFMNFGYEVDIANVTTANMPIVGFSYRSASTVTIRIEGATLYKVIGGVPQLGTPFSEEIVYASTAVNTDHSVAFLPTKPKGYVRISKVNTAFNSIIHPLVKDNYSVISVDLDEIQNTLNLFLNPIFAIPAGYRRQYTLVGDLNNLARNSDLRTFVIGADVFLETKLSNNLLNDAFVGTPIPESFQLVGSKLTAEIDLTNLRVRDVFSIVGSSGVRVFGNINGLLASIPILRINSNLSQTDITGDINSINPAIRQLDIVALNLTGTYTSRTYTAAITQFRVIAPLIPATDYDLILSDLATKAPNMGVATISLSKRTSASDASISALVAKGCTIIIG